MNPTSSTSSTTTTTTVTASASSSTSLVVSSVANTPESCLTSTGDCELAALISQASEGRNEYWPEPNPEPKPVQPPPAPRQDELTELVQELCPDITKEQMAEIFPSNPTSRAIMVRELKKARDTEDLGLMMEILNITSSCGSLRVSLEKSRSKK